MGGQATFALSCLDEGLAALRAEMSALRAQCAAYGDIAPSSDVRNNTLAELADDDDAFHKEPKAFALPTSSETFSSSTTQRLPTAAKGARLHVSASDLSTKFKGMHWVVLLPPHVQGRLSACTEPSEALDVLEEFVGEASPRGCHSPSTACGHRSDGLEGHVQLQGGTWRQRLRDESWKASASVVITSSGLLREETAKADALAAKLEHRRREHEAKVAALRRQHRRDQRRSLRQLVNQLAAPEPSKGINSGPT